MFMKWSVLLLSAVITLTACHSKVYNQTQGNVADVKIKASEARIKSDNDAKPPSPLVMKNGMYVDTTPINLNKQPAWLKNQIVIRGDQLPFSYYSRTIANGVRGNILTKYQVGLDSGAKVSINYSGSIKGALDLLAARAGYVYTVQGSAIYWQAFVTRTYDIAFMPGGTDYLMGSQANTTTNTGNQGGGGGGSMQTQANNYVSGGLAAGEFSSLKGTLSIWKDLDITVKSLLSPQGTVIVSESTTSLTVRDRPTNVQLIGQYIGNLNHNLSKQVLVKVQVLEINLENDFEFGINWQAIANAFSNSRFMINGNYGTPVSITALTAQSPIDAASVAPAIPQFGLLGKGNSSSYTILLNALSQQGKTSVVSEPRVVCLNNQVSVIRIVTTQGYLASIQNTSLASSSTTTSVGLGTVTSQLTPGSVTTGLTLYILPKILNNKVYLQVNADLSTNLGLATVSSGSAAQGNLTSIQVPNVTEKHFNQRSAIKSGDTLILSGFRQVKNIANANQFLNSQALGGKGSQEVNTETIVLITPIILSGSA
ncbi:MAG: type II secretion system protein GspD [Gammaproteobacteria bacterium]